MKKADVKVGECYKIKVSGTIATVRITGEHPHGGWEGVNQSTNRKVRVKSPQRLRGLVQRPAKRKAVMSTAEALAIHKADQENARLGDDRAKSPDGKTASERAMDESAATAGQDRPRRKTAKKAKPNAKGKLARDTGERGAKGGGPKPLSDVERRALKAEPPTDGGRKTKAKAPKVKKPSGLDAAAQVLAEAGEPLNAKTIVERMLAKGLWKTNGRTPWATIYAAVLRDIAAKGEASRFRKTDRGLFTVAAAGKEGK